MPQETIDGLRNRIAKLTEENARLVEAVAVRDSFLAVAAHELRNPMTPIIGRVQMLRRMISVPGVTSEKIAKSVADIEWLVLMFIKRATTLLDVSRLTSDKFKLDLNPMDVCRLIQTVSENFSPIAQAAGTTISLDLPPEPLGVVGEQLAVEEVLDNLVSNAIKYGAGSPIVVSAAADPLNGIAKIIVRDNGPGIPPNSQARIFERFERAVRPGETAGGFGVGLWIIRNLTEAMNGKIEVMCPPGEGSTFCVSLPLAPKDPT